MSPKAPTHLLAVVLPFISMLSIFKISLHVSDSLGIGEGLVTIPFTGGHKVLHNLAPDYFSNFTPYSLCSVGPFVFFFFLFFCPQTCQVLSHLKAFMFPPQLSAQRSFLQRGLLCHPIKSNLLHLQSRNQHITLFISVSGPNIVFDFLCH